MSGADLTTTTFWLAVGHSTSQKEMFPGSSIGMQCWGLAIEINEAEEIVGVTVYFCICLSLFVTNASAPSSFFRFVINCDHCHSPRDQWRQQGGLIGPGWASNFASCRCSRWAWHDAKKDIPEQAKTVSEALACYMWRIVKTFRTHVHPQQCFGTGFWERILNWSDLLTWRLHLWDTHKATVAVTLPPQPSGGTHQMIRGLFMHRSSSSTDPWVSIRAI